MTDLYSVPVPPEFVTTRFHNSCGVSAGIVAVNCHPGLVLFQIFVAPYEVEIFSPMVL